MESFFGNLFDFNNNGETEIEELTAEFIYLDQLANGSNPAISDTYLEDDDSDDLSDDDDFDID